MKLLLIFALTLLAPAHAETTSQIFICRGVAQAQSQSPGDNNQPPLYALAYLKITTKPGDRASIELDFNDSGIQTLEGEIRLDGSKDLVIEKDEIYHPRTLAEALQNQKPIPYHLKEIVNIKLLPNAHATLSVQATANGDSESFFARDMDCTYKE